MKKIIIFLFVNFLFVFSFAENAYPQDIINSDLTNTFRKMYLNSDQITFLDSKIFVLIDGDWVQTDRIESDSDGIYLTNVEKISAYWTCPHCHYSGNSPFSNYCKNCGKRWNE